MKTRIISGVAMAVIAALAILYLPSMAFGIALAVLFGLAAYEWSFFTGEDRILFHRLIVSITLAGINTIVIYMMENFGVQFMQLPLLILFSFTALFYLVIVPIKLSFYARGRYPIPPAEIRDLLAFLLLTATCCSLWLIRKQWGAGALILLIMIVAFTDTCALFCGKRWGKTKLAPAISPGKTCEGSLGGILGALLILAPTLFYFRRYLPLPISAACVGVVMLSGISMIGDLYESLLKRQCGIKDSGNIIPGHGGIMDRFDSLIAAGPCFWLLIYLFS